MKKVVTFAHSKTEPPKEEEEEEERQQIYVVLFIKFGI